MAGCGSQNNDGARRQVGDATGKQIAEAPGDKGRDGGCGKYNREVLEGQKLPVHYHVQYHK